MVTAEYIDICLRRAAASIDSYNNLDEELFWILPKEKKVLKKRKVKYKETKSISLPDNWGELRRIIISRDKVCQDCGAKGHGVHHIDTNRGNNAINNLVYLCWPCHFNRHVRINRAKNSNSYFTDSIQ